MEHKISSDLLRGHTDIIVMRCLLEQDRYGFEIHNWIIEHSEAQLGLKETTLYSSYKRLESSGYISSYWGDESQGARRRYYHLTPSGQEFYRQSKEDLQHTQEIINKLLREDEA